MNSLKDLSKQQRKDRQKKKYSRIESDSERLKSKKTKVLKNFKKLIDDLERGKLSFSYGGRPIKAKNSDLIRVLSEWSQMDSIELAIRNIILNGAMTSESMSPGSGMSFAKHIIEGETSPKEKWIRSEILQIKHAIKEGIGNGICHDIVSSIIDRSGPQSSLNFCLSRDSVFSLIIEPALLVKGDFHGLFANNLKKINHAALLFIDGIIETVGEIDKLLQEFFQSKRNLVIFSRGFSPDVVTTLNKNFSDNLLYVFPFVLSEDDVFFENLSDEFVKIDRDSALFLNSIGGDVLENHYDLLIENNCVKLLNTESIDRHVKVNVPNHFEKSLGIIEDRVSYGIRMARELARFGYILTHENKIVSRRGFKTGQRCASATHEKLENLGCIILLEG